MTCTYCGLGASSMSAKNGIAKLRKRKPRVPKIEIELGKELDGTYGRMCLDFCYNDL